MYKLLLVSDKEEIRTLYENFSDWENLGFERPAVARNATDGEEMLKNERFDAVSWLLSVREGQQFFGYLSSRPEMLGMETARDEERLRREISSARRALSSRDLQRQTKQVDDLTRVMQGEFFCDLMRGAAYDKAKIDERMSALKLRALSARRPAVMASCRMPQGDYFLAEVWRYGRERLENALKNIFESTVQDVLCILLVINPHHMRLIMVPREEMTLDALYERMQAHLARCEQALAECFELTLKVKRIVRYENLYALGMENIARIAH